MRVKLIEAQVNRGAFFIQKELSKEFHLHSYYTGSPRNRLIGEKDSFELEIKDVMFGNSSFCLEVIIMNELGNGGKGFLTFEALH